MFIIGTLLMELIFCQKMYHIRQFFNFCLLFYPDSPPLWKRHPGARPLRTPLRYATAVKASLYLKNIPRFQYLETTKIPLEPSEKSFLFKWIRLWEKSDKFFNLVHFFSLQKTTFFVNTWASLNFKVLDSFQMLSNEIFLHAEEY